MPKRILDGRGKPHLVDEVGIDQFIDAKIDSQAGQQIGAEAKPDNCRGNKQLFGRRTKTVDAGSYSRLQGSWHADFGHISAASVPAALTCQNTTFSELSSDLLGKEGITCRALGDKFADLGNGLIET